MNGRTYKASIVDDEVVVLPPELIDINFPDEFDLFGDELLYCLSVRTVHSELEYFLQRILLLLEFHPFVVSVRDYFSDFCVYAFIPIISAQYCVRSVRIKVQQIFELDPVVTDSDGIRGISNNRRNLFITTSLNSVPEFHTELLTNSPSRFLFFNNHPLFII